MGLQKEYKDALRQLTAKTGEKTPDLLEVALDLLFEQQGFRFKPPRPPKTAQLRSCAMRKWSN